jgi:D-3-phosphoglycerate dehydrogenase/(S)-sulfolactate dehydrogenase
MPPANPDETADTGPADTGPADTGPADPHRPATDPAVVISEDVWGEAFEDLSASRVVSRQSDLWSDRDRLIGALRYASALVVRNRTSVDRGLMEAAPQLKIVARAGVGLDNIDLRSADDLGVVVVAPLGANAQSVAEHTLALALALAKDVVGNDARVRSGAWDRRYGTELAGKTWGVVGLGATGRALSALASALGMRVVGYDPVVAPGTPLPAGVDARADGLVELVSSADVVSLHLPLTNETTRMVDAGFLSAMKPGSYLINVSRGGLIDEEALADSLEAGHLGGAGLDVRVSEPPTAGRLEACDRVVLSPHVAGLTNESQEAISAALASDIAAVLDGMPASNAVGAHRRPAR